MPKLDRYLLGDFVQSFLATLIVLLTVSLGGVLVDVLGEIADGGLPPSCCCRSWACSCWSTCHWSCRWR